MQPISLVRYAEYLFDELTIKGGDNSICIFRDPFWNFATNLAGSLSRMLFNKLAINEGDDSIYISRGLLWNFATNLAGSSQGISLNALTIEIEGI